MRERSSHVDAFPITGHSWVYYHPCGQRERLNTSPEWDAGASHSDGMSVGSNKDSLESGCPINQPCIEGVAFACPARWGEAAEKPLRFGIDLGVAGGFAIGSNCSQS